MKPSDPKFEDFVAEWDRLLKAGKNEVVEQSARAMLFLALPLGGMAKRDPGFVKFKGVPEDASAMAEVCRRYIRLSKAQR